MTIIRHTGVEKHYSKGNKLPLLLYKDSWVQFFPSVRNNWEEDLKTGEGWTKLIREKTTILVPKEFT